MLKNRHRVCPGGPSIQVADPETSVEREGCVPQSGLVAAEGAQSYLGQDREEDISIFIYLNLILLYLCFVYIS